MKGFGCLVMIALLWAGGQGVYEGVRNRSPQTMTCAEAEKAPPTASWLHLTDCKVNVLGATYKTRFGKPTDEVFVPLSGAGKEDSKTTRFVLATKDPDIIAVVGEMAAVDSKDTKAVFSFMAKNAKRLF